MSLVQRVRDAVDAGLPPAGQVVLAVSGGVDSLVLLDAAAAVRDAGSLAVATFDHGTGPHAADAAELVAETSHAAGLAVRVGRADTTIARTESAWRDARWTFLRSVADDLDAVVATGHTRDDQVETVLFRIMRGSGARGLAGLFATSSVARPLLDIPRVDVEAYAVERRLRWIEDPTNRSRLYARNRIRAELLPALRSVCPSIDADLLDLSCRAARWRADIQRVVDDAFEVETDTTDARLTVAADAFIDLSPATVAVVWPVLLARLGIAPDWRGIERLARFTNRARVGGMVQLSGGWIVRRARRQFEVERAAVSGGV